MPAIIIEIADERNRSLLFQPLQDKLRGRWDSQNVAYKRPHPALAKLPRIIPGIQVIVDINKKTVGIVDPLEKSENADLIKALESAKRELPGLMSGTSPKPAVKYTDVGESVIKTWLYWMRRLVDNNQAMMVSDQDSLPKMAEIEAMKGEIRVSQFNPIATRPIMKGDFDRENQPQTAASGKG